ncbi:MAG TPA: tetratricopeptide repeat protein, partial [Archangium sp.]|uniref:tetratricopeptide repeat protein n=1 Tax=Archangium sp. TaxID=1872627 RepID=UPI002EDB5109
SGANKAKAATGRRFHERRRSGKDFGPYEEGVIDKMLEDGQLLGNEDVSNDADAWTPIGTVPTFATAIQKLMEGPGTPATPAAPAMPTGEPGSKVGQSPATSTANMERLNQLYGGRMAAVAVVDSTSRLELFLNKVKQRLPLVIGATAAVAVLGVGLGFGTTRYGVFGLKKFFPTTVKAGSSEAANVEAAHKALLQDSFQGYKQARTLSESVLASDEYPAVRALWCQSVFYLQRRYSSAQGSDLARCRSEEEAANLELLGEKNVEYVKYLAGKALTARDAETAAQLVQDIWSRDGNQSDVELAFLLAESQAARKQNDQAIETLKRVLEQQADSVKAHHALGNLYQATGKADEAVKSYEAALKAEPTRVISALELAAVQVLLRKDAQNGLEATERALDEKVQAQMGPAELARARTLKGIALFQLHKPKEAEQELRAALEKDPTSVLIKGNLAHVLRAQRRFVDALPLYEAVSQAEPQNLEYADGYISTLVVTGKMQDAQKAVEAANKRFPGSARIAYLYGRIDEARDSNASAEQHYQSAIKADAELFEANVYLGRFYLRLRRNKDAREQLELAASKAPQNATVRSGLGELALAEGNIPTAQEEFARAVEFDPNLADAHLGLSRLALLDGDLEKAQTESNTALELDPNLKGGRLQHGTVLFRLGKLDEAIAELEQAKKEDPRSVSAPITLGAVYLAKGNGKEAEANVLLALKSEPSNPEANFQMALVKAKSGEFTQALESMKSAVDRAPKRADYRYTYGVLFRDAKQPADAIEQWKQAVALDPQLADAHEALGQSYLESNQLDEAIKAFQTTLKVDPKRTRALAAIGDAHFTAMRWREAVRSYEQALKADPSLTSVFYKMARCYSEQNQHAKSI